MTNPKHTVLVSTLAVALTGCVSMPTSGPSGSVVVPIDMAVENKEIFVNKTSLAGRQITPPAIRGALEKYFRENLPNGEFTWAGIGTRSQPARIAVLPEGYKFSWGWAQAINYSNLSVKIGVDIEETEDKFRVTILCPTFMISDVRDLSITGIPRWKIQDIGANISMLCSSANLPI